MKKFLFMLLCGVCLLSGMTSCNRIDAGNEGILVNLYGDDRGVGQVSLCTGWVWFNPITEQVFEYPTFVQTIDYPSFTINAKDGSEFMIDPTISMKIVNGQAPKVFKKYRTDLNTIINGPLFNYVKDAFRIELNKYTTDQIVSNRDLVEKAIEKHLRASLAAEDFELEQLTSGLKYPQIIVQAVNEKSRAVQQAQKAENELKVVQAEAQKRITAAQAEAEANKLKTQSMTPAILKQMWIEKWNGQLPKVAGSGYMLNLKDI